MQVSIDAKQTERIKDAAWLEGRSQSRGGIASRRPRNMSHRAVRNGGRTDSGIRYNFLSANLVSQLAGSAAGVDAQRTSGGQTVLGCARADQHHPTLLLAVPAAGIVVEAA